VYSSVIWPGDLCAGFWKHGECDSAGTCHVGGLPASYSAMLGLAVSGYPLYGADTGGYRHERPTREVMLRWGAQTAFSAFMQIGGGSQNNPWDFKKYGPSQFDQALLDAFVVLTRLHTRLFPYLYTLARQAHEHGLGPVRPFGLAHPELAAVPLYAEVSVTQHWLGPDLLVAPILGPESKRRVLLPPGSFYDFWSHTLVAGPAGRVPSEPLALEVEVPLGRIPVYVRAGALVPLLRPTIDTLAPASEPGVDSFANETGRLHVLVAPGAGGAFELYDGSALEMAALGSGHRLDFAAGKVFTQGLELEIWDAKTEPAAVRVNGKPVAVGEAAPLPAAWRAEGVLHVRVDGKAIRVEW
jgi:alpha-D-xyloside xylohydrolase